MKILLKIKYNGAAYCGFQAQADGRAIQNVLTEAFTSLFSFPCAVTGCSRTDSGVHAAGFCATVAPRTDTYGEDWCRIPVARIHRAVNVLLPDDISVIAAAVVPDDFHPRYNVISKRYEYRIYDTPARDPFLFGRAYHSVRRIDEHSLSEMNRAAALFCGKHDFSAFMSTGSKITDPVREVYTATVKRSADGVIVYGVEANGFLYNMVRIMTGTILEIAYGTRSVEDVKCALETGDRQKAGFTAPPEGLSLTEVRYDRKIDWLCE